jgi:aminoglycoside phosphotransferase family enzyme/predicted kinase
MGQFHQQLLDPSTYPDATRSVAFKETHISRIYLTDQHVYKLKKPLNLGFLDFSTLEKRRHFCHEEVRLNQRFSTDIYLGVAELRQQRGKVYFGNQGKILDYAVHMRRLPESRMLNRLIATESPGLAEEMACLGVALHAFMEKAEVCRNETVRNLDVVKQNCNENFLQTRAVIGTVLSAEGHALMEQATQRDLSELAEIIQRREVEGFVRDGHGDLHTANICMTDPICIYDCIEFNRRFRVADIAADLAFLIMDLEFLGRRDLADVLLVHYLNHREDLDFRRLLPFYKRYRAWVRGKVDAMLATSEDASETTRHTSGELARRYFNLALGYLLKPTLFLTCGLMGVGKTTLARALAAATGAKHWRSDVVRKQLSGVPQEQACLDAFGAGLYQRGMTERTYHELFNRAAELLAAQCSVIVDASFAREAERQRFMHLADQLGCPAWLIHLECPEALALARLDRRRGDASDGRRELFARQRAGFDQITAVGHIVKVDTSLSVDYNVQSLICTVLTSQEQLL